MHSKRFLHFPSLKELRIIMNYLSQNVVCFADYLLYKWRKQKTSICQNNDIKKQSIPLQSRSRISCFWLPSSFLFSHWCKHETDNENYFSITVYIYFPFLYATLQRCVLLRKSLTECEWSHKWDTGLFISSPIVECFILLL